MADAKPTYAGAYLVRGGEAAVGALLDTFEKEKTIERDSPDLFVRNYRKFGVEEAEELRARVRTRPVESGRRIFVLFVPAMTSEAQNALLKTLEEPAADAAIFLVTPSPDTLLPTIRSRAQTLELSEKTEESGAVDVADFLAAVPARRLEMLKPLHEHEEEGRDIGAVIAFLQSLERAAAAKRMPDGSAEGIRAIYRARKYASDKGSLLKSLLEQVALLVPKV
ncbi:MAG TPA: hypothetical protein VNM40_04185 [Candidatus Paceibacterota bacterium]|nr:hypothetical protein [Candidatus Paceibacterota bacterium]